MSLPAKLTIFFCLGLYAFHGYRFLLALCRMASTPAPTPFFTEVNPGFLTECDHVWINDGMGYAKCKYCGESVDRDGDEPDRDFLLIGTKPMEEKL